MIARVYLALGLVYGLTFHDLRSAHGRGRDGVRRGPPRGATARRDPPQPGETVYTCGMRRAIALVGAAHPGPSVAVTVVVALLGVAADLSLVGSWW